MNYIRKNLLGIMMVIWAVAMAFSVTTVRADDVTGPIQVREDARL